MNPRSALRRAPTSNYAITIMLGRKTKVLLHSDKQRIVAEAGAAVESLLLSKTNLVKEVWK